MNRMTQPERSELALKIVTTAKYYSRQVDRDVVSMMIDDLSDLNLQDVLTAYDRYRTNPKNKMFPMPAQIREILCPEINPESQGREIAARIQGAIVKYGYANPIEAKDYIGPVGWEIVQSYGGWSYLCENHGKAIDSSVFQAQTRERAKDMVTHGSSLYAFDRPLLEARSQAGLQSIGEVMAGLLTYNKNEPT